MGQLYIANYQDAFRVPVELWLRRPHFEWVWLAALLVAVFEAVCAVQHDSVAA
jgi:hypothetical protein